MRSRTVILLGLIILVIGFLAYRLELAFPGSPSLYNTYTPVTQPAPQAVGSYDVLGYAVDKNEAASLLQTPEGRQKLSPENGAVAVTDKLLALGRDAFYTETFGNEVFFTDVTGILDGPLNIGNLTKAILALGGKHTTNLQVSLAEDITLGDREQLGMADTLLRNIKPDPGASLRVLLDRRLRKPMIAANWANRSLQQSNVDGSGHSYWVDQRAGYTTQEQTDLIQFLLSLDDDPEVLATAQ